MPTTVFFYSSKPSVEPKTFMFTQFHPAPFEDHEQVWYWCTEQYYQAKKALVIEKNQCPKPRNKSKKANLTSSNLCKHVMEEKSSALRITDLTRDFEMGAAAQNEWVPQKEQVLFDGNYFKFKANGNERAWLIGTGDAELVEASPKDDICGIGFSAENAENNRSKWGTNLLGRVLEQVRSVLNEELKSNPAYFEAIEQDHTRQGRDIKEKHRSQRGPCEFNDAVPSIESLKARAGHEKFADILKTHRNRQTSSSTKASGTADSRRPAISLSNDKNDTTTDTAGDIKATERIGDGEAPSQKPKFKLNLKRKRQARDSAEEAVPSESPSLSKAQSASSLFQSHTQTQYSGSHRRSTDELRTAGAQASSASQSTSGGPAETFGPLGLHSRELEESRLKRHKDRKEMEEFWAPVNGLDTAESDGDRSLLPFGESGQTHTSSKDAKFTTAKDTFTQAKAASRDFATSPSSTKDEGETIDPDFAMSPSPTEEEVMDSDFAISPSSAGGKAVDFEPDFVMPPPHAGEEAVDPDFAMSPSSTGHDVVDPDFAMSASGADGEDEDFDPDFTMSPIHPGT